VAFLLLVSANKESKRIKGGMGANAANFYFSVAYLFIDCFVFDGAQLDNRSFKMAKGFEKCAKD